MRDAETASSYPLCGDVWARGEMYNHITSITVLAISGRLVTLLVTTGDSSSLIRKHSLSYFRIMLHDHAYLGMIDV